MPLEGTKLSDRYRLESETATGGMAAVWHATDEVLERPVAAKILHSHLAMDATFRERFRNEALAAAALTHPNIVAVYDTGDHEGTPFIVMELLSGGTLADLIARGSLDPDRVVQIGAAVCRALDYAHAHGVIHRDIKPGNILFSDRGHLKVTDFGIAKAAFAKADLTTTGAVLGTIRYLAPEQVEGEETDERADIYSLGLVLYEAATGRQPFTGETDLAVAMARLKVTPPAPRDLKPEVPRELNRIIMKALAEKPESRYPDAASMARDLESLHGDGSVEIEAGPPTESMRVEEPSFVRSEGRLFLTIVLVLLVGAGLVLGLLWLRQSDLRDFLTSRDEGDGAETVAFTAAIYDPIGDEDTSSNSRDAQLLGDRDEGTAWYTQCYSRPNLGGLKEGVGVNIDLSKSFLLEELRVTSVIDGWRGAVRYSEGGKQWTDAKDSRTVSRDEFSFTLDGKEHRYLQIWITQLARMDEKCAASNAGPWAVGIAEIIAR